MGIETGKISPLVPLITPIKGEVLGDHVFDTLEHFFKPKNNNENNSLLEEVGKEKDEYRVSNSQFNCSINDLKDSVSALKRNSSSCW